MKIFNALAVALTLLWTTETHAKSIFMAYYESWAGRLDRSGRLDASLLNIPRSVDVISLAFLRPDAAYDGGSDLRGTGLNLPYDGTVLRASIDELRHKNPSVKILASVGGETYSDWRTLQVSSIARFVRKFGLDGVDVDYEPDLSDCDRSLSPFCGADLLLQSIIKRLRAEFPNGILTLTAPNVGAFGHGWWKTAKPLGGEFYGLIARALEDSSMSTSLSWLSFMAYDAGTEFDPLQAFEAYRSVYPGPLLIGFSPPPEGWGGHAYSKEETLSVLTAALARGAGGAMIYGLFKQPDRSHQLTGPEMAASICAALGKADCDFLTAR